jgi:hypothetical protein
MPDDPTLGEILRRLDDLSRQLIDLTREIKEDRTTSAATYVRQDVYLAQRHADAAVLADIHGDIAAVREERKKDNDWRRQLNLALASLTITVLVSISLAIVNIVAR